MSALLTEKIGYIGYKEESLGFYPLEAKLTKRILLTGSDGQLGSELLEVLQYFGEVIPTVRGKEEQASFPSRKILDLGDKQAIAELVKSVKPDLIVNPAAYTAVDRAEDAPDLAMKINGEAPAVLAEEGAKIGAELIHFSTDYVYGDGFNEPILESATPNPLNVYGRTKLAGDDAVASMGSGLIVRTSWVYGMIGKNFVKTMLALAKDKTSLKVVDDQYGAPTYARNLAEVVGHLVFNYRGRFKELNQDKIRVIHATNQGGCTWYEFARNIFEFARSFGYKLKISELQPISTINYSLPARRPSYSCLDNSLLAELCQVQLPDWKVGLEMFFRRVQAGLEIGH